MYPTSPLKINSKPSRSSLSRFTIVFDREGYSPDFFAQMKPECIAVLTYHKFPGELWPEQEFRPHL